MFGYGGKMNDKVVFSVLFQDDSAIPLRFQRFQIPVTTTCYVYFDAIGFNGHRGIEWQFLVIEALK